MSLCCWTMKVGTHKIGLLLQRVTETWKPTVFRLCTKMVSPRSHEKVFAEVTVLVSGAIYNWIRVLNCL